MSDIRQLMRQSTHYFGGRVGLLLLGFISFPLFTRMYSLADYGLINLVAKIVLMLTALSKLGLQNSVSRFYKEHAISRDRNALAIYFSSIVFGSAGTWAAFAAVFAVGVALAPAWLIPADVRPLLLLAAILIFTGTLRAVLITFLRAEERTRLYNILEIVIKASGITLICLISFVSGATAESFIKGTIISEVLGLLLVVTPLVRARMIDLRHWHPSFFRKAVVFGMPLIGLELGNLVLDSGDRLLVAHYLGAEALGLYSAASNIAAYVQDLLMAPVLLAVVPIYLNLWAERGSEETRRFLGTSLQGFVCIGIGVAAITAPTADPAVRLLASSKFAAAAPMVPLLVVGLIFFAMVPFFTAGLYLFNRTGTIAVTTIAAALLNLGLNVVMLPSMGLTGGVLADVIGYAALLLATAWVSVSLFATGSESYDGGPLCCGRRRRRGSVLLHPHRLEPDRPGRERSDHGIRLSRSRLFWRPEREGDGRPTGAEPARTARARNRGGGGREFRSGARMNLMLLADAFLPRSGGSRVYYYNLYKRLAEQFGHRVTVVTKKVPGWQEFDSRECSERFRVVRSGAPLQTWRYQELPKIAQTMATAAGVLARQRIDLIQTGDMYPPGLAAVWLKRLAAKPYLTFIHGDELAQMEERRYQPVLRDLIFRNASALVAANEFARNKALAAGVEASKIHLITPGVDLDRFRPEPRDPELVRRYGLEGKLVLLTAARLAPKKGHATVIQALAKVLPDNPNIHYLIAGDGTERARLENLTDALGLRHAVTFVGNIPNELLGTYYNLCDIFVMANRRVTGGDVETFGMVFIEANATGKPVIGGRSGGAIESVEHGRTGFLADPDDIDEWAQTMGLLISNEELRRRLGNDGLKRVRSSYTWDSRAAALHDLCMEIAPAGRSVAA